MNAFVPIAIVLGLISLALGVKLLYDLSAGLRGLSAQLPTTHDLRELRQAITAQHQLAEQLPVQIASRVAGEVRNGLVPVKGAIESLGQTLAESHERLNQVLASLDREGELGEWVVGFRETAQPFQLAAETLAHHYQTNTQLLNTAGTLVQDWGVQREAVQKAFFDFSAMVERSQAAEITHLRDIEHRIMQRLEEVAESSATAAHNLSELQTSGRRMQEAHESLGQTVETTVGKVSELLDLGRQTQTQHHELIRAQESVQKYFEKWHVEIDERIGRFLHGLEQAPARVGATLEATLLPAANAIGELGKKLEGFHRQHSESLAAMVRQQNTVNERQAKLVEAQQRMLESTQRQLGLLPSRQLQVAILALVGLQTLIMGALVLGYLTR